MLGTSEVMAFVATTDAPKSLHFYRNILGLKLVEDTPFAYVFDAHGTSLRVQKAQDFTRAQHTVLGWKVADIAATIDALIAQGVSFERYPYFEQDARGVWSTPDGAKVAWFKDPDGNVLSLTQF